MKTAKELFEVYLPQIETALEKYLPVGEDSDERKPLFDAMRYAVLDGGKRIRPVLVLEFCRACGGDPASAIPFACAIEMIHSYSLVHDDLPCMDDDDLRRGKPSTHKAFGEANALLAGDALLTYAFQVMLFEGKNAPGAMAAAACLAKESGCMGMIGGQVIDLSLEGKSGSLEQLRRMDDGKTVGLIRAACRMGCLLAGEQAEERLLAAEQYAEKIGLAFQIQDDILDLEGDAVLLGKPIGSDAENEKTTYVSVLGLEKAKATVKKLTEEAIGALALWGEKGTALAELAVMLSSRNH